MDRRRIILKPEGAEGAAGYGTFKRITESDHGSMPSVIRFGGGSRKDRENVSATAYGTDSNGKIVYSIPGTIGDGDLEFHVEFDENLTTDDDDLERFANAAKLKADLEDDEYAVCPIGALLSGFVIYEVDDASYQAMSALNYDFFPKVFATVEGSANKIIGKAVCALKSYTLKKAWIMIDKKVRTSSSVLIESIARDGGIETIILDSGIILTKAEKANGSTSRFQNAVGLHSNLCGALSDPATYSPMHDLIQDATVSSYSSGAARSISVSKQAGYFRQMTENTGGSAQHSYKVWTIDGGTNANAQLQLHTIGDHCKNHIYVSGNSISDYAGRRCYDIYKIVNNGYFESRVLTSDDQDTTLKYEVYAFIATYARYVFSYVTGGITADDIRKKLIDDNRFMRSYDLHDSELFLFGSGSTKYAEVLIPIYEDNSHRTDEKPDNLTDGIELNEIPFGNDQKYPVGISVGSKYANPTGNKYILPYVYANKYAADYYGKQVPSVHSDELNMFELRQFSAADRIFDIIDGDDFISKDGASESAPQTSEAMRIDGDDIISQLQAAGYRDPEANAPIFAIDTSARTQLYDNLAKMVFGDTDISKYDYSETANSKNKDTDVHEYSIALASIGSSENLTRTIFDGSHEIKETVEPYQNVDGRKYYILPLNVDGIASIKFDHEVHVVY